MIKKITLILICVVFALPLFASNGTQIGTVGARATAMGSCFRGLADDWTAIFFNPAGLTQIGKWTFGGSMGLIIPSAEFTPYAYALDVTGTPPSFPFAGIHTTAMTATEQRFYVPSAAIAYRYSKKLVFGLGVYAPFGLGTEWDLMTLPSSYGNTLSKEKEHFSDHQVINIQPTVAYQLSEKVSVGLGLSLVYGKMIVDNVKLPFNPAMKWWPDMQERADLLGLGLTDLTMDQCRIAVENSLDGSGFAVGANLGVHVKLSDKFSFGLSGRFSTDLKLKGSYRQTMNAYGDVPKISTLDQIPAEFYANCDDPTGVTNKQNLMALFSGQYLAVVDEDEVEASLPLPMTVGVGIAWKCHRRFTLTADASFTHWAAWDEVAIKADGNDLGSFLLEWENTFEAGFGYDWLLLGLNRDSQQFFWRGGFYSVATPVSDLTINPTILDSERRFVFTQGFGFNFEKIAFNVAYEYVMFNDKDAADYVFNPDMGYAENWAGKYIVSSHVVSFDVSVDL
ncbi:outer membrane protein transport protein [bacterium]|nr:outer membrane protein transport protein [bacterium]